MTRATVAGRQICLIHPYPSAVVLERLKREGCRLVLVGGEVPHGLAEEQLDVPLTDFEGVAKAVIEFHRSAPIDVMLPLYEGTTALTAQIALALGLRGNKPQAALASRSKYRTYESLVAAGVKTPLTIPLRLDGNDVVRIEQELGFPAVVKLADSMNSQGITRVDNKIEAEQAVARLRQLIEQPREIDSRRDRNRIAYGREPVKLIAQKFCRGAEFGVDLLYSEHSHVVMGVFEKAESCGPYFPEHMSVSPTSLGKSELEQVCELAVAAVRALGLTLGAAHVEIRFDETGPKVLELGARPGGGLTIDAVESLTGLNSVVELVRLLLGEGLPQVLDYTDRAVLYGGKVYTHSGKLVRADGVAEARRQTGVSKFFQLHKEGDLVFAMPESAQPHFCYYLIEGNSRSEVLATHDRIRAMIALEVQPRKGDQTMHGKTAVECVSFRLRAGISDSAFLEANAKAQAFLRRMSGFQKRELLRDSDGWLDIVHWETRELAIAAAQKFPTAPEFQELMSMFDPSTVQMRHLDIAMSD